MRIGLAWSTYFDRPWHKRWLYRRLRFAYRAPSLFMAARVAAGDQIEFLTFDEMLTADDLDGTAATLAHSVDLLYLAAHGACPQGQFQAILQRRDWEPARSGLGDVRPVVAVF